LTTAIANDLERRGFIVYVVTSTAEDEQHIRKQSRVDLLPFNLDLVYASILLLIQPHKAILTVNQPGIAEGQMQRFHHFLSRHHHAFEGASVHRLTLAGVILVPDVSSSAVGSISQLSPEAWSTALNAKVLHTITTAKLLLPLVTEFRSRILILTPNVVSSLRPPYRAIESTVSSALGAFAASLSSELSLQGLHACHFKLGNIEIAANKQKKDESKRIRGTSIRKLHESIFDALHSSRPGRTWHIGRGSLIYDIVGSWLPGGVVSWMMGLQQAPKIEHVQAPEEDSSSDRSITWEKI
jgi:NAD(P)-dependent dehydrogenase (short-subunit alcohol dehydrogenase family)